ncbi:hypothetical protein HDE_00206 [Halotydeus destructor]|nr:hypothetical protein HDE_00206 [Halotydeus destructor]
MFFHEMPTVSTTSGINEITGPAVQSMLEGQVTWKFSHRHEIPTLSPEFKFSDTGFQLCLFTTPTMLRLSVRMVSTKSEKGEPVEAVVQGKLDYTGVRYCEEDDWEASNFSDSIEIDCASVLLSGNEFAIIKTNQSDQHSFLLSLVYYATTNSNCCEETDHGSIHQRNQD